MRAIFLAVAISCSALFNCAPDPGFERIDAADFEKISKSEKVQLIDARTAFEFEKSHIPGALHVDFSNKSLISGLDSLDRNVTTIVYCSVGGRSYSAAQVLVRMGFSEVYDLQDGFSEWLAHEKEEEKTPYLFSSSQ